MTRPAEAIKEACPFDKYVNIWFEEYAEFYQDCPKCLMCSNKCFCLDQIKLNQMYGAVDCAEKLIALKAKKASLPKIKKRKEEPETFHALDSLDEHWSGNDNSQY